MHTRTLKKLFLALTFWLALHTATLRADLIGPYSNSAASFDVDANGLLSATSVSGAGSLSLSGIGTRMFWFPGAAAFRAGYVSSSQWDSANVGWGSVAFGYSTTASGWASTAFGGLTLSSGGMSTAFGGSTTASAAKSTASGAYSTASGYASTVLGHQNISAGNSSLANGFNSQAWADYSTSLGYNTYNACYAEVAIGAYNVGGGGGLSNTTWYSADPLFEIGNGNSTTRSDALVIYKNGNGILQGTLQVAAGGDIPMFTGY